MDKWPRRLAYYLVTLGAVMLGYALAYHFGMRAFEGEANSFLHSLQIVVETFTTTGFGSDAPWTTPEMNILVILMDLTGVVLIFMALPVLVFPLFEDALSTTPPTSLDADVSGHVVIATYTPRAETLIAELDSWGVDHAIVEPDRERATELYEAGQEVIHADPESVDGLRDANLPAARAIVADVSDRVDASIVLAAGEIADGTRIVSVVEDPDRARYHHLAGADAVLTPRSLLGESLADKVTTAMSTELDAAVEIDEDFDVAELPIHRGSELVGRTLAEAGLRERTGVNVIGAWYRGEFRTPPDPRDTLESGTVLLVTGRGDQLEALKELTLSEARGVGRGETIIVGYGEVGATVAGSLDAADLPYTVVDRRDVDGVDVVGDATDPDVLAAAGLEDARSVILCLPDDTITEFATLVIRDMAADVEVIARAEAADSSQKVYRAGADYVLSLSTVTGRMIASAVLEGEEVISADTQVEVVRTTAPGLDGRTLGEARIRARTNCTVVAVERDGSVVTDLGPEFRFEAGDEVVVAGPDEGTNRFRELHC